MNDNVKTILDTLKDDGGTTVPNALLHFDGKADTFLVYSPSNESVGLAGDDQILGLGDSWDVDVYCKGNYNALSRRMIKAFVDAGWVYKGASQGTYDETTQLYHRLYEFEQEGDTMFLEEGEN